jgi:hypothetical protein
MTFCALFVVFRVGPESNSAPYPPLQQIQDATLPLLTDLSQHGHRSAPRPRPHCRRRHRHGVRSANGWSFRHKVHVCMASESACVKHLHLRAVCATLFRQNLRRHRPPASPLAQSPAQEAELASRPASGRGAHGSGGFDPDVQAGKAEGRTKLEQSVLPTQRGAWAVARRHTPPHPLDAADRRSFLMLLLRAAALRRRPLAWWWCPDTERLCRGSRREPGLPRGAAGFRGTKRGQHRRHEVDDDRFLPRPHGHDGLL